jgi:hypothetical protein
LTVEQLEAARAERMRQNGHGTITIEDVRTWIEETGLCIFLPRSAQAGFTAPTFVEAVAGQRTTEPTLELIASAEALLVRLEAEGVAVRLNLAGQPGDQPDYVVAGWVLPYIYALRGDRDWRRSPQLTGSRQVSQLAVLAAKQLDSANMTAAQIRDALGREVTETAVLRALHELWKQLRIIPVVPEIGKAALWQPLRQRFQKAIAEGASTSQVTAISVLASIYLQAVIAASMEDVEMFLSPLTSRSKIREVVRGLAATRQVHSTTMGHSPMFYVAGTLPEFPAAPSIQISTSFPAYRGSTYLGTDPDQFHEDDFIDSVGGLTVNGSVTEAVETAVPVSHSANGAHEQTAASPIRHKPLVARTGARTGNRTGARPTAATQGSGKASAPRPRTGRNAAPAHPRERSRAVAHGESRIGSGSDRRRAPMPRGTSSTAMPASRTGNSSFGKSNTNGHSNGHGGSHSAKAAGNGNRVKSNRPGNRNDSLASAGSKPQTAPNYKAGRTPVAAGSNGNSAHAGSRTASRPPSSANGIDRNRAGASAAKRYSFSGQAKQAPKTGTKVLSGRASAPSSKAALKIGSKVGSQRGTKTAASVSSHRSGSARPAEAKRRG